MFNLWRGQREEKQELRRSRRKLDSGGRHWHRRPRSHSPETPHQLAKKQRSKEPLGRPRRLSFDSSEAEEASPLLLTLQQREALEARRREQEHQEQQGVLYPPPESQAHLESQSYREAQRRTIQDILEEQRRATKALHIYDQTHSPLSLEEVFRAGLPLHQHTGAIRKRSIPAPQPKGDLPYRSDRGWPFRLFGQDKREEQRPDAPIFTTATRDTRALPASAPLLSTTRASTIPIQHPGQQPTPHPAMNPSWQIPGAAAASSAAPGTAGGSAVPTTSNWGWIGSSAAGVAAAAATAAVAPGTLGGPTVANTAPPQGWGVQYAAPLGPATTAGPPAPSGGGGGPGPTAPPPPGGWGRGNPLPSAPTMAPPLYAGGYNPSQGHRRIPPFGEADDPRAWLIWKRRFHAIAAVHGWTDEQRRRELFIGMTGDAAAAVCDIDSSHYLTFEDELAEYDRRFLTTAASDAARAEFGAARQLPGESVLTWHGRLRDLYLNAYPQARIDVGTGGQILIERFVLGLESTPVKEFVLSFRPSTYAGALATANQKVAALQMLATDKGSRRIHALRKPNPTGTSSSNSSSISGVRFQCYACGGPHFKRDCPKAQESAPHSASPNRQRTGTPNQRSRGTGRGATRGNRTSGRGGAPAVPAGKTQKRRPRIHAIMAPDGEDGWIIEEDPAVDGEEPEAEEEVAEEEGPGNEWAGTEEEEGRD